MSRPHRSTPAGEIFHVVNRGNDKRVIFSEDADYQCFTTLLDEGRARADINIIGYCLMTTHFHLMLRPGQNTALSAYMHWVTGCYARYVRRSTATIGHGHVFQRRYWAEQMRDPLHVLTALGYVEGNALTAGLVTRAEQWPWGSLYERCAGSPRLVDANGVSLPSDWVNCVNLPRDRRFQSLLTRLLWFPRPNR